MGLAQVCYTYSRVNVCVRVCVGLCVLLKVVDQVLNLLSHLSHTWIDEATHVIQDTFGSHDSVYMHYCCSNINVLLHCSLTLWEIFECALPVYTYIKYAMC